MGRGKRAFRETRYSENQFHPAKCGNREYRYVLGTRSLSTCTLLGPRQGLTNTAVKKTKTISALTDLVFY